MIMPQSGNLAPWQAALTNGTLSVSAHVNVMRSGVVLDDFPAETVKIVVDRTQAIRRTCTLTLAPVGDVTLDPSWMDLFAAAGNEVRPWYQMALQGGGFDEVCLGTFTIVSTTWEDTGADVVVTVTGQDRAYLLNESMALEPITIAQTTVDHAIAQLLAGQDFGVPIAAVISPTDVMVPSTGAVVKPGKTIWSQISELAAIAGYEAYMDVWGNLVAQPMPNPSSQAPVATLSSVSGSATILAKATSTRSKVYSVFGVVGAGTTEVLNVKTNKMVAKKAAIYSEAADNNPSSPTYVGGGFGRIQKLVRSGLVTDQASGDAMAAGLLSQQVGAMTGLDISIIPWPLLDAWDVVTIEAARLGVSGNYVIDGYDLTVHFAGTMSLTVREVL